MKQKRDLIAEILQKRSRAKGSKAHRWIMFHERANLISLAIAHVEGAEDDGNPGREELLKYIPVALVAAMESYFRLLIKELINYGNPFRRNAQKLEDVRVDLPTILQVQGAKISMGELLSHLVPLSSLEDIQRHLSTILGEDFFAAVKNQAIAGMTGKTGDIQPTLWPDVNEVYRKRNVVCHEWAFATKLTVAEARKDYSTVLIFALATDDLMIALMPTRQRRRVIAQEN